MYMSVYMTHMYKCPQAKREAVDPLKLESGSCELP